MGCSHSKVHDVAAEHIVDDDNNEIEWALYDKKASKKKIRLASQEITKIVASLLRDLIDRILLSDVPPTGTRAFYDYMHHYVDAHYSEKVKHLEPLGATDSIVREQVYYSLVRSIEKFETAGNS